MKRLDLNLTSVIVMIAAGVLLPVMLSTAVGIVAIAVAKDAGVIVMGVLVISFAVTAAGSGLIALVLASRKARLARQQSDFIANISHEFRTPLSAIRLYAQTLESGKVADDPEQMARCVATILRETEWLDVMIDRVLIWRASSKDMMNLTMEAAPITQVVRDALERFVSMVPPDDISVESSIDSRLPVMHDASALNAVVLNLLTNAYKYTGKDKKVAVTVRDDGDCVLIEVKDNGIGLNPVEKKLVFQSFYRGTGRIESKADGVGLGLSIARRLVEQHKGSINVRSEKGKGAVFCIQLPAIRT